LHKLAPRPPGDPNDLVALLWEKHALGEARPPTPKAPTSAEAERKLVEHLNSFIKADTAPDVAGLPADELESLAIERLVPPKRGGWWVIPKDVADREHGKKS
jgi:hypothetical protein